MPTRDLGQNQRSATRLVMRNEARIERALTDNYAAALNAIRSDMARVYERYAINGRLANAEMTKYNRLRALDKQIVSELRPTIEANRKLIEKAAEVQYDEAFYRRAWSIDQAAGVSLRWGMLSAEQVRAAVANDLRHLAQRGVARETLERVRRAITQGVIRGTTLRQMMSGVRQAMENTGGQAMRIVRTEAHRSRELGALAARESAVNQGVELTRVWDASLDTRTRSAHARLDGKPESEWRLGGIKPEYPGDPRLAPEHSINCRCTATDVVEGFEPKVRRTRENGLEPYQTFGAWAERHGVRASRYGEEYNFLRAG